MFTSNSVYYTVPYPTVSTMKTLLVSCLFLIFGCKDRDTSFTGDKKIEFTTVNNIPIIKGLVNNQPVYFIVDSGASLSVLDKNQSSKLKFFTAPSEESAAGYSGIAVFHEAFNVDVSVGDLPVKTKFRAQDMSAIVQLIREAEGIYISGIIGSDVWRKLGAVIDYNTLMNFYTAVLVVKLGAVIDYQNSCIEIH